MSRSLRYFHGKLFTSLLIHLSRSLWNYRQVSLFSISTRPRKLQT